MGNNKSVFSSEQMEAYQDCTYFNKQEILRFRAIMPDQLPQYMDADQLFSLKIPKARMKQISELKENPFQDQILKVFTEDASGNMCFNDFINMLSVMCESSPRELKSHYCFHIHDFDGDGYLNASDMEIALKYITNNELEQEELDYITSKIIEEADLDEDKKLSEVEFELMLSKCPDFLGLTFMYCYDKLSCKHSNKYYKWKINCNIPRHSLVCNSVIQLSSIVN